MNHRYDRFSQTRPARLHRISVYSNESIRILRQIGILLVVLRDLLFTYSSRIENYHCHFINNGKYHVVWGDDYSLAIITVTQFWPNATTRSANEYEWWTLAWFRIDELNKWNWSNSDCLHVCIHHLWYNSFKVLEECVVGIENEVQFSLFTAAGCIQ